MIIPEKLLAKWKVLRSPEDTTKLSESTTLTPETFQAAFRKGKCSDEVFKAMAEFYEAKENLIKEYL